MKGRGVLPSQWLENNPNECDMLFAIRQYFFSFHGRDGATFRARVGVLWLSRNHLCILGKVQPEVRDEALARFRRVEASMGLEVTP